MGTVREVDSRLQETLSEGRKLLGKLKRKHAELLLLRQTLPKDRAVERAELLELGELTLAYQSKLKQELAQAHDVAHKIEGHLLWKNAVRDIWGEEGLQQCYAHMTEQEAERSRRFSQELNSPE